MFVWSVSSIATTTVCTFFAWTRVTSVVTKKCVIHWHQTPLVLLVLTKQQLTAYGNTWINIYTMSTWLILHIKSSINLQSCKYWKVNVTTVKQWCLFVTNILLYMKKTKAWNILFFNAAWHITYVKQLFYKDLMLMSFCQWHLLTKSYFSEKIDLLFKKGLLSICSVLNIIYNM